MVKLMETRGKFMSKWRFERKNHEIHPIISGRLWENHERSPINDALDGIKSCAIAREYASSLYTCHPGKYAKEMPYALKGITCGMAFFLEVHQLQRHTHTDKQAPTWQSN